MDISVIIPVYHNADTLEALTKKLVEVLFKLTSNFELIFVNDASPDESEIVLQQLMSQCPQIIVITLSNNLGQQEAIRRGIIQSVGKKIVVMDADLQDSPEAIIQLNKILDNENLDAVFAAHRGKYQSLGRMICSHFFKWIIRQMTGLPKNTGSFVIFTRKMANHILAPNTKKFYLAGLIGLSQYPISSLGIKRHARANGESAYSPVMRLKVALSYISCLIEMKYK